MKSEKTLLIVESPKKAKIIKSYLDKSYKIVPTKGHIFDIISKKRNDLSINLDTFEPIISILPRRRKDLSEIKKYYKEYKKIIFATDYDREGEAIAYHLASYLKIPIEQKNRAIFLEITKKTILKSIINLHEIDKPQVNAQKARRIIDRLIGYLVSSFLIKKFQSHSAGRVQSVVLNIMTKKQKEINSFITKPYWNVSISINTPKIILALWKYQKSFVNDIEDIEQIKIFREKLENINKVYFNNKKERNIITKPPLPFKTSSLLAVAYNAFGYSAKRTSVIIQSLYEGIKINNKFVGLITYIRTDSTRISAEFQKKIKLFIQKNYKQKTAEKNIVKKSKVKIQDAHEAIRPVNINLKPYQIEKLLTQEQFKLYRLIYYRTIAFYMDNHVEKQTTSIFSACENKEFLFKIVSKKTISPGFSILYKNAESENNPKIDFKIGDSLDINKIDFTKKNTKPPHQYNEGKIIKYLEENGIGRPSTYNVIIPKLINNEYLIKNKKKIEVTIRGELTNKVIQNYFYNFFNVEFTSKMEGQLEKIANSKHDYYSFVSSFYSKLTTLLEEITKMDIKAELKIGDECPKCKKGYTILKKNMKNKSDFIGCSKYIEGSCKYIKTINTFKSQLSGLKCENCKTGDIVTRKNRKNNKLFLACNNFPKCRNILKNTVELKRLIKKLSEND